MAILWIIVFYFLIGVVALGLFDLATKRVRDNLRGASYDSQSVMTKAGVPLSARAALVITIVVMLLFWPAPIYGALSDLWRKEKKKP